METYQARKENDFVLKERKEYEFGLLIFLEFDSKETQI
jgi:hypothetical protein